MTRPDYGAGRLAGPPAGRKPPGPEGGGAGERALPCLQGGLGVQRAPFPPRVRRRWRSPSLQGRHSLRAAKGARRQKAADNKSQDRAPVTGRSPSAKPARAPQRCPRCSYVTAPWRQGGPFAQGAFLAAPLLQPDAAPLRARSCLDVPHDALFFLLPSPPAAAKGTRTHLGPRSPKPSAGRKQPRRELPEPPPGRPPPHTNPPTSAPLTRAAHSRVPAGAGAGLGGGHPGQLRLGRHSSAQRGCTPAYRGLEPLPGLQSARDARALPGP